MKTTGTTFIAIISVFLFGSCLVPESYGQDTVKLYKENLTLPTYPVHEADVNPMFFKGESYQGASKHIYPYPLIDNLSHERTEKDWLGVYLENEYIKACVTPEIGGKLYWAEDKTTNYNFFYKNNVVKPANIGMLGAWVSGGVEWNVLHHHRASTFMPIDYTTRENEDGSKTIFIGETEPRHRMRWIVGLTVFPGKAYIQADVKIMNQTPLTHSFLYWANVSTHCNSDYQVYFPSSTDYGTDHSKVDFTHWPVTTDPYRGKERPEPEDVSLWKNHPKPTSIFCHNLKEDFMGGYDHGKDMGTVHVADHHIVTGAKMFEWGPSELGQMWDKVLTDKDGPYIEIMVGAYSDNQPDYSWIRPYEVKSFKQYWYPVSKIGGIKNANLNGAVNLEFRDNGKAFFGFSVTQKFEQARVVAEANGKAFFEKTLTIEPGNSFVDEVKLPDNTDSTKVKVTLEDKNGNPLIAYQPVKHEYAEGLPEFVKPPLPPSEIETVEQLYLTGLRLIQFYNPVIDPMPYFEEALKRDPGNSSVNTILGKEALKDGRFDDAGDYFRTAIARLTKDYTRPENCEAFYGLGQVLQYQEKYDEAIDTLYRATWDYSFSSAAYHLLAQISCVKQEYPEALEYVNRSLKTNSESLRGLNLKAAIERHLGNNEKAIGLARQVLQEDPLNLTAACEWALAAGANGESREDILITMEQNLTGTQMDYTEAAVSYMDAGMFDDAIWLLERYEAKDHDSAENNAIIDYYLGYLNAKTGNPSRARDYYQQAASCSTDYGFPFRMETMKVLKAALKEFPSDAKAYYYSGNLLYDHQPLEAMLNWEKAVKADPDLAIAYRNLGWAYNAKQDIPNAIREYEKAIDLKKDDPVYFYELDCLYELNGTSPEIRLQMLEPNHEVVMKRNDSFLREIMVLTLNNKPEKAVRYLTDNYFHIREGDMRIRDINVDAHLLFGKKLFGQQKYGEALEQFQLANTFPENQQVGRTLHDHRIAQINYYTGIALEALGKRKKAREAFMASVSQDIGSSEHSYYQGLAYLKLGNATKADRIFDDLISAGTQMLTGGVQKDAFAKFGEKLAEENVQSMAYLKLGLGYLGKHRMNEAQENLAASLRLNPGNLWAREAMKDEKKQIITAE